MCIRDSYAGEALVKMNAYFKERDPDRLVHYEGVFRAPAYKDRISDMESHMYSCLLYTSSQHFSSRMRYDSPRRPKAEGLSCLLSKNSEKIRLLGKFGREVPAQLSQAAISDHGLRVTVPFIPGRRFLPSGRVMRTSKYVAF